MSDQALDPGTVDTSPSPTPYTPSQDVYGPPEPLGPPAPDSPYTPTQDVYGPPEQFGPPSPSSSIENVPPQQDTMYSAPSAGTRHDASEPTAYASISGGNPSSSPAATRPADPLGDAITSAESGTSGTASSGGGSGTATPSIPSPVVSTSSGGGGGSVLGVLLATVGGGILATYLYQKYAKKHDKKEAE